MALPMLLAIAVAIVVLVLAVTVSDERTSRETTPWRGIERGAAWLAVALAALPAAWLLIVPTYSTITTISSDNPHVTTTQRGVETLLGTNGIGALPVVLLPILLAAFPLFRGTPHQRRVRSAIVAVILVGFTIVGGFSIGLFYIPSALATLTAATLGVVVERRA
jgi:hypothetical protein